MSDGSFPPNDSTNRLLERVEAHWRLQGLRPTGGVSREELTAFEQRHGVRFPADVAAWFLQVNGTDQESMDDEMISFWSLGTMARVAPSRDHESVSEHVRQFFSFADYSIHCYVYAVRLSADGLVQSQVVVVYGDDLLPVAPSFAAFLEGYLDTPDRVLHPLMPAAKTESNPSTAVTSRPITAGSVLRRVAGACILVMGVGLAGWILYNLLIQRLPEALGINPAPAILVSALFIYVGIRWRRGDRV